MNPTDDSTEHGETSQKPATSLLPPLPAHSLPAAPAFHSDDVEHVANYQVAQRSGYLEPADRPGVAAVHRIEMFLLLPLIGAVDRACLPCGGYRCQ